MKLIKKSLVGLVATSAVFGLSIPAFAATDTQGTTGKVDFTEGSVGGDIDKPGTGETVTPEPPITVNPGALAITYAPTLDFGTQKITSRSVDYSALEMKYTNSANANAVEYMPSFLKVEDVRGKNAGWKVNVSATEFKTGTGDTEESLIGATIRLKGGKIYSNASSTPNTAITSDTTKLSSPLANAAAYTDVTSSGIEVLRAAAGSGDASVTSFVFNNDYAATPAATTQGTNDGIQLHIPAGSGMKTASYSAALTWTLADTPD